MPELVPQELVNAIVVLVAAILGGKPVVNAYRKRTNGTPQETPVATRLDRLEDALDELGDDVSKLRIDLVGSIGKLDKRLAVLAAKSGIEEG